MDIANMFSRYPFSWHSFTVSFWKVLRNINVTCCKLCTYGHYLWLEKMYIYFIYVILLYIMLYMLYCFILLYMYIFYLYLGGCFLVTAEVFPDCTSPQNFCVPWHLSSCKEAEMAAPSPVWYILYISKGCAGNTLVMGWDGTISEVTGQCTRNMQRSAWRAE